MDFGYVQWQKQTPFIEEFSEKLKSAKLMGTKCKKCSAEYLPPREHCQCGSKDMDWIEVNPEATLYTYTVIMFAPESMASKVPYVVAVGEFGKGKRVLAHLIAPPNKIQVGMKMKLVPQEVDAKKITWKFVAV